MTALAARISWLLGWMALLAPLLLAQAAHGQAAAPILAAGEEPEFYRPLQPDGLFHDPFEAPPLPLFSFADPVQQLGALATQVGVLHGENPPPAIVPRVGIGGVFGTHTSSVDARAGLAGVLPVMTNHAGDQIRLTFNILAAAAANDKQWGYNFAGEETRLFAEVVPELPILYDYLPSLFDVGRRTNAHLAVGYRLTWYDNNSYDRINGRPTTPETDQDLMSQRLATLFLQLDFTTCGPLLDCVPANYTQHRIRFEFENDSVLGGDGGDEFRTHTSRLLYLAQSGPLQLRAGLLLELFTGQVDLDATVTGPGGEFFDTTGLAFNDRSMGFFGVELGASWFHPVGFHYGELGFNVTFGPDTEGIRDTFQNEFVHQRILGIPQVPRIDRGDRFRFDAGVFYILHF